jgi:hypothetical protein
VGTKEVPVTWTNEKPENSQIIFSGELLYRSYRLEKCESKYPAGSSRCGCMG